MLYARECVSDSSGDAVRPSIASARVRRIICHGDTREPDVRIADQWIDEGSCVADQATNQRLDALLGQVAKGDRQAFAEFYAQTVDRCMGLAVSVLGSRIWAEDCVADAYVAAWRQAATFDATRAPAIAWLFMICRTRAIDRLRREQMHVSYSFGVRQLEESAEGGTENVVSFGDFVAVRQLHHALKQLTEQQRTAVELAYFQGMSHSEVAAATGWPIGTTKSYVRRALAVLRKELIEHEDHKRVF
jgi:RNA polymerase sigma factor (sigma-70 family)